MRKFIYILPVLAMILLGPITARALSTYIVDQGGTGRATFTPSQLLYGNGTNPLSSVATTTLTASSPLSLSNTVVKVGGSNSVLTCTNASSGVTGCLTGTDWNTFNGKQAAGNYITALTGDVTATGPNSVAATLATVNGNTGSWGSATQVGTFTVNGKGLITAAGNTTVTPAVGSITGLGTGVATALGVNIGTAGSFVVNGGALGTPSSGTLTNATGLPIVGGTTGTLTVARGGTGSTTAPAGQVIYGGGDGTYQSRATTTVTCSGNISCTTFDVLGATPITITGSGGLTSYDAWTHPVAGYSATTSAIGVGTSTAWAFLGVNPTAGIASRSFVVGSSTGTLFEIENDGRVGIGTSTIGTGLMGQVNIEAGSKSTGLYITGTNNGFFEANIQNRSNGANASSDWIATADNGSATSHYLDMGINGSGGGVAPFPTANHAYLYAIEDSLNLGALGAASDITFNTTGGSSPAERARLNFRGDLGIGTTTPRWRLTVASSTGPQITLTDGSLTSAPTNLRSISGNFYLSTSSPTTFATSTPFIFMANGTTGSTTLQKLDVIGTATTTHNGGIFISAGGLKIAALSGMLRATSGAVLQATAGTDYVAGGTGSNTQVSYFTGSGAITGDAGMTYVAAADRLTALYASSTSKSSTGAALFGTSAGNLGIGTTSPTWATLAVNPIAGLASNQFAIGSSTGTSWLVNNGGFLARGTTTPPFSITLDRNFLGVASSSILVTQYNPATSTSQIVNCRDSNTIYVSLGTGATTITLGAMLGGQGCVVAVSNPAATGGAITWATTGGQQLNWTGGVVPTQTTTANKMDLWSFKAVSMPAAATSTPRTMINGAMTPNF